MVTRVHLHIPIWDVQFGNIGLYGFQSPENPYTIFSRDQSAIGSFGYLCDMRGPEQLVIDGNSQIRDFFNSNQ